MIEDNLPFKLIRCQGDGRSILRKMTFYKKGDFDTIQSRHFMHVQSCVWGHNLLTNLKAKGKLAKEINNIDIAAL